MTSFIHHHRESGQWPRTPKIGGYIGAWACAAVLVSTLGTGCVMDMDGSRGSVTSMGVENPSLEKRCGVDLVLVMDASSSVRNYNDEFDDNGAVDLVANAARAFLGAFANTNSRIAVVSYNADPVIQLDLADVSTASIAPGGVHDQAIGDPGGQLGPIPVTTGYSEHARSGSGTNWEAGLASALEIMSAPRPGVPQIVVHITDGRPTRHLDASGAVTDVGSTDTHVAEAAEVADTIKAQDIHIYSVGIGRATSASFTERLQAVSGPDVFDQADPADVFDPSRDDVILASDFVLLEDTLATIASGLCGASLTITKLASTPEAPDAFAPAAGWTFTAQPAASGGFDWMLPDIARSDEKTVMTDASGRAQFQWEVHDERTWSDGLVTVIEAQQSGFALLPEVTCTRTGGTRESQVFVVAADVATGLLEVPVGAGEAVTCEVRNQAVAGCVDTAPPVVDVVPFVELWPPNHKYHTVTLDQCVAAVTDDCDDALGDGDLGDAVQIVSVYSDEPDNATGDGNTTGDIEILDGTTVRVRAERRGMRDGRVYGIVFTVTDAAGNATTATCLTGVPHDQSGDPPVDSGPDHTVP